MSECPERSVLKRLELGRLELDEENRVREHMARCPYCAPTLSQVCPSLRELEDYHHGRLTGEGERRVRDHASRCPLCRQQLQRRQRPSLDAGARVGEYEIVEFVGAGGFGEVYRARRLEGPPIEVALKIIRGDRVTPGITARFDTEIDAMALMDHPNVAKVYDSGVAADGRPYIVMEYVRDGLPLTAYCDRHRLNVDARVELFRQVCEAVTHAHQKGIIHRDLTPGNILVREAGETIEVKVIDFGLARLLGSTTAAADVGRAGTPGYISPEQLQGSRDVDARADVYTLGVLLHHLLIGVLPYEVELERARQRARQEEPTRPSHVLTSLLHSNPELMAWRAEQRGTGPRQLGRRLRPDLDWVVLTCLQKERARRYRTVDALAEDVRNFQNARPVSVRSNDAFYRARKFVSRNRWPVAAGMVVTVVAISGLVGWTTERARATAAEGREARLNAKQLVEEARLAAYDFPGVAERKLNQAIRDDAKSIEARLELAHLMLRRGSRDEARALLDRVLQEQPRSIPARAFRAGLQHKPTVDFERLLDDADPDGLEREQVLYYAALGEEDGLRQIELLSRSLAENPWQFAAKSLRGVLRFDRCDYAGALEDSETLVRVQPRSLYGWMLHAAALSNVAIDRHNADGGDIRGETQALYTRAIDALERVMRIDDREGLAHYNLAIVKKHQGEAEAALEHVRRSIELQPASPKPARLHARLLLEARQLITTAEDLEWYRRAEAELDRALDLGGDESSVRWYRGKVRRALGDFERSLQDFEVVAGDLEAPRACGSSWAPARHEFYKQRGLARIGRGDYAKAEADFRSVLDERPQDDLAAYNLARVFWLRGDLDAALAFHVQSIEANPKNVHLTIGRGLALWAMRRDSEAFTDFIRLCEEPGYTWTCLWAWEAATRMNDLERARSALAAAFESPTADHEALLGPVVEMLRGQRDPQEVVRMATNDLDRLYADYFAGVHASIKGDRQGATQWFDRCLENRRMADQLEYDLCVWKRRLLD